MDEPAPQTEEAQAREEDRDVPKRVPMAKQDLFDNGFTNGCPGCQAVINQQRAKTHSEACRKRMQEAMDKTKAGVERKSKAADRQNEWLARKIQTEEDEHHEQASQPSKRNHEDSAHEDVQKKVRVFKEDIPRPCEEDHQER